ncbi:MAG: tetratricopeptide repeat protein [Sphingomonas sp.]|nr:tetratricopeptide repeat protein [Sphingomonas sp.]
MKSLALTTALATIAALSATPAAAQYTKATPPVAIPEPTAQAAAPSPAAAAQPQVKLSKKASKAIIALQTAVTTNDTANIPAKLAEAQALAETADDRYAIGQLQLKSALAAKNDESAALAIDAIAASGIVPGARSAGLYNAVGINFYNAKNFDRAAAMFEKGMAADPKGFESLKLLAEARNSQGRAADAAQLIQKSLAVAAAAGQKPTEDVYKRAVSLAYNAKLPIAVDLGRQWVQAYPNSESWHNAVAIYRNMMRPEVESTLDLLRLLRAANALSTSGDYTLYATAASEQGNFGEAKSVIDEGLANKKVDAASSLARDIIKGLKAKPIATAAEVETASKSAKTSTALNAVGNRFYGLGNYTRAAELYRAAAGAGGDSNLANLHLGMALARAGDKAGATAALKSVSGAYAPIANYWLLFVGKAR